MGKTIINKPLHQRDFIRFSEQIDSIKKPISSALWWVLEYEKNNINYISSKLFNSKNKIVTQQDIDNAKMFLTHYCNQLKRLKEELINDTGLNEPQKKLLINTIQGSILRIILLEHAMYLEAEKWGYPLDEKKKTECLEKINEIESIIYGPRVIDQPEERTIVMTKLDYLFQNNKHKLLPEEQKKFEELLSKFPERNATGELQEDKNALGELPLIDICHLFQKILNIYDIPSKIVIIDKNISQEKDENGILYLPFEYDQKALTKAYERHNIKKTFKITLDPRVSWFGIKEYSVDIPTSRDRLSVKRLCQLIDHEITTHLLRTVNKRNTVNLNTEWYLETEEWIATMNEKLTSQKRDDLAMDTPTIHNTSLLIGELYNFEETKELLRIYYTMTGVGNEDDDNKEEKTPEIMAEKRALRVKRYHAFDRPGANRKDVVYRRGLVDAVTYIKDLDKNNIDDIQKLQQHMKNFYLSKLGKEEIQNADQIFEGFSFAKDSIILPIAIGKLLYEKLLGNKTNDIDDIRFLASDQKLDYKQKKLLLEILSFIKERSTAE